MKSNTELTTAPEMENRQIYIVILISLLTPQVL